MHLYDVYFPQTTKMLTNLLGWLDKAEAFAKAKECDVDTFLTSRLALDQYPLLRQVQSACDSAKSAPARLLGIEPPKHPDTEKTFAELRTRVQTVLAYLETFKREQFDKAESTKVQVPFLPGKGILGSDYILEMTLPNFYFHITTAYAILRHNGVQLGKREYIGAMKLFDV